jgi:hypothetical protein
MNKEYQLSILLPSAPPNAFKRKRFIQNLLDTVSDFHSIELVICLDADDSYDDGETIRNNNVVYTFRNPSKYRSRFFDGAWKASTGKFLLMANDDILFKTKNWDKLIPYDKFPDELVMFYFRDNEFNETFACHPVWSRKAMNYAEGLFEPKYAITKCDNTIWDMHPSSRRVYLPEIELEHRQAPYGLEWKSTYDEDNSVYLSHENVTNRKKVLNKIMTEIGLDNHKVLIGITTGEYARRADFYDYFNMLEKPANSICITVHGHSIAANRNKLVEAALIHNCSHVFFLDDDVICRPDALLKLLSHDKDIVVGLQYKRNFPHRPLIFNTKYEHVDLTLGYSGLLPIFAAGLGAALIKTEVFRRFDKFPFKLGQYEVDQLGEDSKFFQDINGFAFRAFCDLDVRVGHIGSMAVWPEQIDGNWYTIYDSYLGEGRITVPQLPLQMNKISVPTPIEEKV